MSDSYFDSAPKQSDWGYNSEGSMFNDPVEAVKKGLENCAGIKQGTAMGKAAGTALALAPKIFDGEATFEDWFTLIDEALNAAVAMIECVESLMATTTAMTGDPGAAAGVAGQIVSTVSSMGMAAVLEFFQPIQDLVGMFTGNPERITTSQTMWVALSDGLVALGDQLAGHSARLGEGWSDDASDAAQTRILEGREVIMVASGIAQGIATALAFTAALFQKIQGFLMNRLSDLFGFIVETIVSGLTKGPGALYEILLDLIPMLLRITLELVQLGMYVARALGFLVGVTSGAQTAIEKMNPYLDRMSQAA